MKPTRPASTTDEAQLAQLERLEELRERLATDDLVVALKHPQVRRVLWRILEQTQVFQDVFTPDALELSHRAGRQSVGRYLWAAIDDVDPGATFEMRREARARAQRELLEAEAARTPTQGGDT